jgi:N-acyl-L-homoserine lactone synthetase
VSIRHPALARREDAGLIIIDVQDAFRPVIDGFDSVVANCGLLAEGFGVMGRPVIVTEQYPKGLGHTVPELAERLPEGTPVIEKTRFSACGV